MPGKDVSEILAWHLFWQLRKIGKDFTFCRFFQFRDMYEKVLLPILRRVHAEIVCHIAAEVGWRRETEDVGDLHEREAFVAQQT